METTPQHQMDMTPLVTIFVARPYLFANTQFHELCKKTWAERCQLHYLKYTEYAFAHKLSAQEGGPYTGQPPEDDPSTQCFRWDKIKLLRSTVLNDMICQGDNNHYTFELVNEKIGYVVEIYDGQQGQTYLTKHDRVLDLSITLGIRTKTLPTHIGPEDEDNMWGVSLYCVWVRNRDKSESFIIVSEYDGDGLLVTKHEEGKSGGIFVTDHNIFEIIAFMKTSRLNLIDYLPCYKLVTVPTN
jgi:hypothetical protein